MLSQREPSAARPTDYHWLVLYLCLPLYCDLLNDRAIGDHVGPHEIERIR